MPNMTKFRLKGKAKDSYLELVLAFPLTSIQSEEHLLAAQSILDQLLQQNKLDRGETLYLDALSDLVAQYEDEYHPIAPPDDGAMLRHLLDAKGITQATLHRETGLPKSTISEVLAGKKSFSRQMIRKLADYFQVDVGILAGNF